jgi:hypothetical protein
MMLFIQMFDERVWTLPYLEPVALGQNECL